MTRPLAVRARLDPVERGKQRGPVRLVGRALAAPPCARAVKALPEGAAQREGQVARLHGGAPVLRRLRPGLQAGRQQRLDLGADRLAEDGRRAIGRDRHDQRRAVDQRAEGEIAEVRLVDDIDRHAGLRGRRRRRRATSSAPRCRRWRAPRRARSSGCQRRGMDDDAAGRRVGGQRGEDVGLVAGEDMQLGARRGQQLGLPQRALAAAGQHDLAPVQLVEQRQGRQRLDAARVVGSGRLWLIASVVWRSPRRVLRCSVREAVGLRQQPDRSPEQACPAGSERFSLARGGASSRRSGARSRAAVLAFLQAALAQGVGAFEDRIADRGDMAVDPLEVANDVEMDRAGLDRFSAAAVAQALEMALRGAPFGIAHRRLLGEELARQSQVARREDVQRQNQPRRDALVEVADLGQPFRREGIALADLLLGQFAQVLVDDVADMLEIRDQRDDLEQPAALLVARARCARPSPDRA